MPPQAELTAEASFLHWNVIRELVWHARRRGYQVSIDEGPGWIFRTFIIKGDRTAVRVIDVALEPYCKGTLE
jgi:hypothetical protein